MKYPIIVSTVVCGPVFVLLIEWYFATVRIQVVILSISKDPILRVNILGDPEVTANLYCNFAYLYWESCVICSIYLGHQVYKQCATLHINPAGPTHKYLNPEHDQIFLKLRNLVMELSYLWRFLLFLGGDGA